jgi:micrococcal nuclease
MGSAKRMLWFVATTALVGSVCSACRPTRADHDGAAVVTHVVDGDTIDVRIDGRNERVRLIGIDTPETKKPNTPIQCFGPEASLFTSRLLAPGTRVRLERDRVGRDDYGRLLAYIYLAADNEFVNLDIIERGYARPLSIPPNTAHAAEFARAALDAEHADIGLWAACADQGR